jgi:hypothetical protein
LVLLNAEGEAARNYRITAERATVNTIAAAADPNPRGPIRREWQAHPDRDLGELITAAIDEVRLLAG